MRKQYDKDRWSAELHYGAGVAVFGIGCLATLGGFFAWENAMSSQYHDTQYCNWGIERSCGQLTGDNTAISGSVELLGNAAVLDVIGGALVFTGDRHKKRVAAKPVPPTSIELPFDSDSLVYPFEDSELYAFLYRYGAQTDEV